MDNEELIIAKAFKKIKEGVLSGDWKVICEAYEDISGEKIEPPEKPKSKLEKIRELMTTDPPEELKDLQKKNQTLELGQEEETQNNQDEEIQPQDMTKRQLMTFLFSRGVSKEELSNKKKNELVELAKELKVAEITADPSEGGSVRTILKFVEGGNRFAIDGLNIIEAGYDPEEAAENKKNFKPDVFKRPKFNPEQVKVKAGSEFGYINDPPLKPNW